MRQLLLSSAAIFLIGSAAHAESVTVYTAAPGQAALAIGKFQSDIAGSKPLDLTVGIGSAAFRDPRGATDTFYTLADRGSNFTCDEAKGILGLDRRGRLPGGRGGQGRRRPHLSDPGLRHLDLRGEARSRREDLHGRPDHSADHAEGRQGDRRHQPADGRLDREAARRLRQGHRAER